jgi:hypothetical protein
MNEFAAKLTEYLPGHGGKGAFAAGMIGGMMARR